MSKNKNRRKGSNGEKGRGRPAKKKRGSMGGRKKVPGKHVALKTQYERAQHLLKDEKYSFDIVLKAANIIKKKGLQSTNNTNEDASTDNDLDMGSDGELNNCISTRHSEDSGLAFFLEYNYSVRGYKGLVSDSHNRKCYIYPSYYFIKEAMNKCLPQKIVNTEVEVKISLQSILNKTVERLCESIALDWDEGCLTDLEFLITLGFDSSSGHNNPHQKYSDKNNENLNHQSSLFISSFICISIKCNCGKYIWLNKTPQSVRYCRPIRLALEKEDNEATLKEYNRLNQDIENLRPHRFLLSNNKLCKVKFNVYKTLFDGKCLNTILENSASSRCPCCLKTAHQFGKLNIDFTPNSLALKNGLGLLHCLIKTFEHLLAISKRKIIEVWDVKKNLKGKLIIFVWLF